MSREKVLKTTKAFRLLEKDGIQFVCFRESRQTDLRDQIWNRLNDEMEYEDVTEFGHRYPIALLASFPPVLHILERVAVLHTLLVDCKAKHEALLGERLKKGMVEMGDLVRVFPAETNVVVWEEGQIIGGTVKSIQIKYSFGGSYISVSLSIVHALFGHLREDAYEARIDGFRGLRRLSTLGIRKLTPEHSKTLAARGKKFVQMSRPGTYASYNGTIDQPSWWNTRSFKADGRVVIDSASLARLEPEIHRNLVTTSSIQVGSSTSAKARVLDIPSSAHWRCMPYLYGFSMTAKQWGRLLVDSLRDVEFRETAFETLVLDEDIKKMIKALVEYHKGGFTDIIEGKGGGCIFLLHGPPGQGKTSSAEAVAEVLHRPIYTVGAGELGTNTTTLETKLRSILEVASIWNAVILLDEADIFLEARDVHDVERNAMVGVFLRLLEYHDGILFLTTNRVENIDKAFYSRISVAIHYGGKDEGKREKIWHNLLHAARVDLDPATVGHLAKFDVNGRQIKNAIRIAQTLARSRGAQRPVKADLQEAIQASLRFAEEMAQLHPKKDAPPIARDSQPEVPAKTEEMVLMG